MHRHALAIVAALVLAAAPSLAAEPSPIAEGKKVFEKKCATCHSLDRALAQKASLGEWDAIVKRMVEKGASLDAGQTGQLLGYLGAKSSFEAKCNVCHDLQRPLTAIKDPDQWLATVQRMAAMRAGLLTDPEAGAIALYLSLVAPVPKK